MRNRIFFFQFIWTFRRTANTRHRSLFPFPVFPLPPTLPLSSFCTICSTDCGRTSALNYHKWGFLFLWLPFIVFQSISPTSPLQCSFGAPLSVFLRWYLSFCSDCSDWYFILCVYSSFHSLNYSLLLTSLLHFPTILRLLLFGRHRPHPNHFLSLFFRWIWSVSTSFLPSTKTKPFPFHTV